MRRCGSGLAAANMTTTWSTLAATIRSPCPPPGARRASFDRRGRISAIAHAPALGLLEQDVVADGELEVSAARAHGVAAERPVGAGGRCLTSSIGRAATRRSFRRLGPHAPDAARPADARRRRTSGWCVTRFRPALVAHRVPPSARRRSALAARRSTRSSSALHVAERRRPSAIDAPLARSRRSRGTRFRGGPPASARRGAPI